MKKEKCYDVFDSAPTILEWIVMGICFLIVKKLKYLIVFLLIGILFSCTSKREGEIVMDKDGNFYTLTHENAFMGGEMYRLKPIDTTKFKVKGFNNK